MFHTKFILFAAVALLAVGCAFAIIGGQDAARGQFPYYAYLNAYKSRSAWSLKRSVSLFSILSFGSNVM